jgi:hypothetical protein
MALARIFGLSPQRPVQPPAPWTVSLEEARLTFILHEYDKVKDEMLASITSQHTTMTYGLTATAAIFTGLLATWDNVDIRLSILSLAPIFLTFIWFIRRTRTDGSHCLQTQVRLAVISPGLNCCVEFGERLVEPLRPAARRAVRSELRGAEPSRRLCVLIARPRRGD